MSTDYEMTIIAQATHDVCGNIIDPSPDILPDVTRTKQTGENLRTTLNINPNIFADAFLFRPATGRTLADLLLVENAFGGPDVDPDISNIMFRFNDTNFDLGEQFQFFNILTDSTSKGYLQAKELQSDVVEAVPTIFLNVNSTTLNNKDEFRVSTHALDTALNDSLVTIMNTAALHPFSAALANQLQNPGGEIMAGFGTFQQQEDRFVSLMNKVNDNLAKYTVTDDPFGDGQTWYRVPFAVGDSLTIFAAFNFDNPFGVTPSNEIRTYSTTNIIVARNNNIIQDNLTVVGGYVTSIPERLVKLKLNFVGDPSSNLIMNGVDISNSLQNDVSFVNMEGLPFTSVVTALSANKYIFTGSFDVGAIAQNNLRAPVNRNRVAQYLITNPNTDFDTAVGELFGYDTPNYPTKHTIETSKINNAHLWWHMDGSNGGLGSPGPLYNRFLAQTPVTATSLVAAYVNYEEFISAFGGENQFLLAQPYPSTTSESDFFNSMVRGVTFQTAAYGIVTQMPSFLQTEFLEHAWLDAAANLEYAWLLTNMAAIISKVDALAGNVAGDGAIALGYLFLSLTYNYSIYNYYNVTRNNTVHWNMVAPYGAIDFTAGTIPTDPALLAMFNYAISQDAAGMAALINGDPSASPPVLPGISNAMLRLGYNHNNVYMAKAEGIRVDMLLGTGFSAALPAGAIRVQFDEDWSLGPFNLRKFHALGDPRD